MPNALAGESSPYLRQHQDNPVDWLPWGPEALARARETDRPLLVSIGYSACHWCHVMERESFEDPATAAIMNERFVCVKVDREERPDVDAIYMQAVQAMTGHGGWPLNVFITPDQVPFFGGTYFPPTARHGMPSWPDVLSSVAAAWKERRPEIESSAQRVREHLAASSRLRPSPEPIEAGSLDDAVRLLADEFDERHGGFGGAPKFPPSCVLEFLLARAAGQGAWRERALQMSVQTLEAMAAGGIHDIAGGGFARYAVDRTWTVPHFEKMLYDNALLLRAYTDAWLMTADPLFERTASGIVTWVLREMRAPEGGFYSALDADSEGVEGAFYVWAEQELTDALGDLRDVAMRWLTPAPFEGSLVLEARGQDPGDDAREQIRTRLLATRATRVRPGLDDKRLAGWNGLMIGALSRSAATFGNADWLEAARDAARFVLEKMVSADGRLLRTSDGGNAKLNAYLEDHAFLLDGLLDLYEATFEPRWFAQARRLADTIMNRFADDEVGGFFSTSSDHEALVVRRKDLEDSPIPAGSSAAALALLRLAALTGEARYEEAALGAIRLVQTIAPRHPQAFGHMLRAMDLATADVKEVALVGDDVAELAAVVREELRPHIVLAGPPGDDVPLMQGREPLNGRAAAYVCERFSCRQPVSEPAELRELLRAP